MSFGTWLTSRWSRLREYAARNSELGKSVGIGVLVLGALGAVVWLASGDRNQPATPPAAAAASRTTSQASSARAVPGGTPSPKPSATSASPKPSATSSAPAAGPVTPPPAAQQEKPFSKPGTGYGSYTVVRGDTLASIALRVRVPFEQIAKVNKIAKINKITVGQKLVISPRPTGVEVVEKGESMDKAAAKHGVDKQRLVTLNPHISFPPGPLAGGLLRIGGTVEP